MPKRCHTPRVDAHELTLLWLYRVLPPEHRLLIDRVLWRAYLHGNPESGPEGESAWAQREWREMRSLKARYLGARTMTDFEMFWAGGAQ